MGSGSCGGARGELQILRILVTNDDGIASKGISVLASAIASEYDDVFIVAPQGDKSGAGAAIGPLLHHGNIISFEKCQLDGLSHLDAFSIDGTPALAVILALLGAFGEPPDLVLSGINPGSNTGKSVMHSGTVGAALTASSFGIRGLAVSLSAGRPHNWQSAASIGVRVIQRVSQLPNGIAVNLNVPNLPLDEIKDIRSAKLAPFGGLRTQVVEKQQGKLNVELQSTSTETAGEGTDVALLRQGFATITVLSGLRVTDSAEFTNSL